MSYPVIAKRGYWGHAVELIQRRLNKVAGAGLATNGKFGSDTEAAVIAFQRDNALKPDGLVGMFTNAALTLKPFAKRLPTVPPHVPQGLAFKCWAAATESWLQAHPLRTKYTMDQIIEGMKADGFVHADCVQVLAVER